MSDFPVGTRVLAILKADKDKVYSLGEGEYTGLLSPPEGPFGMTKEEVGEDFTNPCIKLDSGKVVWGYECWWGPADIVREKMGADREWVTVDIDEARERVKKHKARSTDDVAQ